MSFINKLNHKTMRRLVFSAYVIITIFFCLLLLHVGKNELDKAQHYADSERAYVTNILLSRKTLNRASNAFETFQRHTSSSNAQKTLNAIKEFRRSINILSTEMEKTGSSSTSNFPYKKLKRNAQLLHSVSNAAFLDTQTSSSDQQILLDEACLGISQTLKTLRGSLQQLLERELSHVETWQRQSFFFFTQLQQLLVIYFITATLFSVMASYFFSYILKTSLRRLSEGTKELSNGNLSYRFGNIHSDEIGKVMYDFNSMALRLERQSKALTEANKELRKNAEALIDAHQHKDRFLANMSHELRTPLNSVIGFAELLIQRAKSIPVVKTQRYASRILNASEHLLDLISDLLEMAGIDAGILKPVLQSCDLKKCITDTTDMLKPLAEKRDLKFEVTLPETPLFLNADKQMIKQILINLINNAIKFTHKGRVDVSASISENSEYRVDVRDTGIGIDTINQKEIFRDFHRVEQGLTSNYEGVGIGLTLTKRLVELHNGRIIVSSEPEKGSCFSIFLPFETVKKNSS